MTERRSKAFSRRLLRLPPNAKLDFLETVERDCGCIYDKYTYRIWRFRTRCESHAPMCRALEDWEMED